MAEGATIMKRSLIRSVFCFVLILVASFSNLQLANAAPPTPWYGRGWSCAGGTATRSYFNGMCPWAIDSGGYESRVVREGIPGWVTDTSGYYSWLQSVYSSGGRNQTAAAYIVNTMLGNGAPGGGRVVSGAQWSELQSRLSSHSMNLEMRSTDGVNTRMMKTLSGDPGWDPNLFDVQAVNEYKTAQAWVFYDSGGAVRYIIFTECANPVGDPAGLNATPPPDFNLTPVISVAPIRAEPGEVVSLTSHVNNVGSTSSFPATWQVAASTNGGPRNPIPGASGTQQFPPNSNTPVAVGLTQTVPDLTAGSTICYVLTVTPAADDNPGTATSLEACMTVSERPKVQVLGGDLVVGRPTDYNTAPPVADVVTRSSYSNSQGRYFGSWSEYGIIPSGTVTGMASGAMYVGGLTPAPGGGVPDLCTISVLTIGNRTPSGCQSAQIGRYSYGLPVPNTASRFKVTNNIGGNAADINGLVSGEVYSVSGATLDLSSTGLVPGGTPATKGKWVVINDPEVTVTIKTNINYSGGPLTQIDDIPQVVIIARNIIIDPGVTNVDAWLLAVGSGSDGYINTCGSTTPATLATASPVPCRAKLTVNGPILANKLYMYRTTTAGTSSGNPSTPAEVFNLRADAYIWASAVSPGVGRVPTVTTKELPPRF